MVTFRLTSGSGWVEAVEADPLRWNRSRQLENSWARPSAIQVKGLHTNVKQIKYRK
jgi:hypothetical protein